MFQNAKIQDLNVIHNTIAHKRKSEIVVSECKDTRFECNSQQASCNKQKKQVVSECKDTRFECNSQQYGQGPISYLGCFRMQRYKI